ncbi:MAG TPA: DUF3455 domain-containing protein [Gemmatimonadales bacterium]|nr:DUF3455 domain-containing protein [Gemmatimonadales bacterium]
MSLNAMAWLRPSLLAVAAAALAACNDQTSLGPEAEPALAAVAAAAASHGPDLGTCGNLAVEAGSKLVFRAYARGVQIYQWSGTSWAPVGPSATLYADAGYHGAVGTHYAGPTWESSSGSLVVAGVKDRCPLDAADVPWLLLDATHAQGPGIFERVSQIQRVNTVGGPAPAEPGASVGEIRSVPYTAEYFFYRAP